MEISRIATVLTVLGTCLVGGAVTATNASATSYGCDGSLVKTLPIGSIGEAYVYWDGTYNCAVAVDNAKNASWITLNLVDCAADTPQIYTSCQMEQAVQDGYNSSGEPDNSYHWYAGPVNLKAGGHCLYLEANINVNGENYGYGDNNSTTFAC